MEQDQDHLYTPSPVTAVSMLPHFICSALSDEVAAAVLGVDCTVLGAPGSASVVRSCSKSRLSFFLGSFCHWVTKAVTKPAKEEII